MSYIPNKAIKLVTARSYTSGATFQSVLDAASALGNSTVQIGTSNLGSTVITVPTNVDLHCTGEVTFTGDGGFLFEDHQYRNHILWVRRNTFDWDDGADTTSIGVTVKNSAWTTFGIKGIKFFHTGLKLLGDGDGVANNTFNITGIIWDNKINIQPAILNTGWVNANTFIGGQIRHSSGYQGSTRAITNVAVSSNIATITTSTDHGITIIEGRTITLSGLTNTVLNGTWTPTAVPTSTTITFSVVTGDIASVADSGTLAGAPYPGSRGIAAATGGNAFNGNTIIGVNFEGNLVERTVDLNGPYNVFLSCRWEQAVGIWMTSIGVHNKIIGGYHADLVSITDASSTFTCIANGCVKLGGTNMVSLGSAPRLTTVPHIDFGGPTGREFRLINSTNITGSGLQLGTAEIQTQLKHTGSTVGFYNTTPVTKRTLGAAATDAATTQTLANNLRQALIDLGLGQT